MRRLLVALLLVAAPVRAGNSDGAAWHAREQYLKKVNLACGLELTIDYDVESLRRHDPDIAHDQTGGSDECDEPLRYAWYACKDERGRAALAEHAGGPGGTLTYANGTITVERVTGEDHPFFRSQKQFEAIFKVKLPLPTEEKPGDAVGPYYDEAWHTLGQQPNPVTSTTDYCLANGQKVELAMSLEDPFERRHEDATVKCWKGGEVVVDLVVKQGKKSGLTFWQRDERVTRVRWRDGRRHGEETVTEAGKLRERTIWEAGEEVTRTRFRPTGALEEHSHHYAGHYDRVGLDEKGRVTSLQCSPQAKDDEVLRKWCGFAGAVTHSVYDGTGKVAVVQTWRDGVLQREEPGDSAYARGAEVAYEGGKKHGEERVFRRDRKLAAVVHWDHGTKDGRELEYADDGQKIVKERVWKAGRLVEETERYLNGNPKLRETYPAPGRKEHTRFWDTGKRSHEGVFVPCARDRGPWCADGVHKTFYESGALESETTWKAGQRHGPARRLWEDGRPAEIEAYEDDVRKKSKRWDRDGKLVADEEYEADGSRKVKR